jgi:hypothetical protein
MNSKLPFFLLIFLLSMLFGCANQGRLGGGPKDETPPRLDSLASTPNFQTRFQKQTIVLAFDEWVELKDVFNQVVVSPPLEFRPTIERKKKTIQFQFDDREVLRDSATYVINFGQAIKDLTEGNVAPIVFVFSTGDFIDSLSVEGSIRDAFSGKPVEKALFMLYENLADSVVRTERPFYFAITDKEGKFKVSNVKSGAFKVAALLDQNLNYRFDSEAEQIGFLDSNLVLAGETTAAVSEADSLSSPPDSLSIDSTNVSGSLSKDSTVLKPALPAAQVALRLFSEDKALFLRNKETGKYGVVKLTFSRDAPDAIVTFDSLGQTTLLEQEKDTIRLWYHTTMDTTWRVYVKRDTATDTVLIKSGLRQKFMTTDSLKVVGGKSPKPERLTPGQLFSMSFSHPLIAFEDAKISLTEDSLKRNVLPKIRLDSLQKNKLIVDFDWKEGLRYELLLLPGSVTDMFGFVNKDTLRRSFTIGVQKEYGTLTIKAMALSPDMAYVLRLLDKPEAAVPLRVFPVAGVRDFQITLPFLTPATFTIELIEDLDRNGRWTTGNYDRRRQPERVARKTLEALRANWELEGTIEARFE